METCALSLSGLFDGTALAAGKRLFWKFVVLAWPSQLSRDRQRSFLEFSQLAPQRFLLFTLIPPALSAERVSLRIKLEA